MKTLLATLLLLCHYGIATHSHAQASFFDPTFGVGGKTIVPLGATSNGSFNATTIQTDGKILVAGIMTGKAVVARFNENGTPDTSFGINGFFQHAVSSTVLYDIVLQPDGKILAEGYIPFPGDGQRFLTVRLNTDGTADATFGTGGTVSTDFGPFTNDWGQSLALQADGKIVIAGRTAPDNMGLARLHADGSPDSSFGTNGLVVGPYGRANAVAIGPDGKIVAGGHATASHDYALMAVRYLTDGRLDTSFGHTGIVYTIAGEARSNFGRALEIQTDGRILLAGSGTFNTSGSDFTVIRYNTDGSLDGSFGSGGIVNIDFYGYEDGVSDMCIASDGNIVLLGSSVLSDNKVAIALTRLESNGTLDNLFGVSGKILASLRNINDNGLAVGLQSDGKIIVAGNSYRDVYPNNFCDPALSRYTSYPSSIEETLAHIGEGPLLFPNPATEQIFINSSGTRYITSISAYNLSGRCVHLENYNNHTVNISSLENGLYIFQIIYCDGTTNVQKIRVEK